MREYRKRQVHCSVRFPRKAVDSETDPAINMFSKSTKERETSGTVEMPEVVPAPSPSAACSSSVPVERTAVGAGSLMHGELEVKGDLHIDGEISGRLHVQGRLIVGRTGIIHSEGVECSVGEISGSFEGALTATELLTIHAGGHVTGDISVQDIVIEKGGRFDGRCQYFSPKSQTELAVSQTLEKVRNP